MSDLIKLCGLWESKNKNLEGGIGMTAKYVVMPNKYKNKSNQPDYILFMAKAEPKQKRFNDTAIKKALTSPKGAELIELDSELSGLDNIPF